MADAEVTSGARPRTAWVVTSGYPGHTEPCIGVAEELGLEPRIITVRPSALRRLLAPWFPARRGELNPPWPDLLIASGRQSIPYARQVRRLSAGRTFVAILQNPVAPASWFDLVWVNEHDTLRGPNVVRTLTTPNRMTAKRLKAEAEKLKARIRPVKEPVAGVVLGGAAAAFRFGAEDAARLGQALKRFSDDHGIGLAITPSRRTGEANIAILRESLDPASTWIWDGTGENPYFGILGLGDPLIVTSDSVNMLGEAAATGTPVYGYALEGDSGKIARFHQALIEGGAMRWFDGGLERWTYDPINATHTVAAEILSRYAARQQVA